MGISSLLILILFSYFALIGLIASIAWSFKNEAAYKMLSTAAGFDLNAVTKTSETTSKAMKFLLLDLETPGDLALIQQLEDFGWVMSVKAQEKR